MSRGPLCAVLLAVLPALAADRTSEKLPLVFADDFTKGAGRWQPTDPKAWKLAQRIPMFPAHHPIAPTVAFALRAGCRRYARAVRTPVATVAGPVARAFRRRRRLNASDQASATPFAVKTFLTIATLRIDTISAVLSRTSNSSSMAMTRFIAAMLSHCGVLSGEVSSVITSGEIPRTSANTLLTRAGMDYSATSAS